MANEKNLIKPSDLTPSERRENASKAGKASGKARRRKRDLKACAKMLLDMPIIGSDEELDTINQFGFDWQNMDKSEFTNALSVMAALIQRAKAGDVSAIKELCQISGEGFAVQQKMKLERDKLKLEKEKLEFMKEKFRGDDDREVLEKLQEVLDGIGGVV